MTCTEAAQILAVLRTSLLEESSGAETPETEALSIAVSIMPNTPLAEPPEGYAVTESGLVPTDYEKRNFKACYGAHDSWPRATEVARAKKYLQEHWVPGGPGRHGTKTLGSYGFKHHMQGADHESEPHRDYGYATNGAFIQAALELGFPVKPDGSQINANIMAQRITWVSPGRFVRWLFRQKDRPGIPGYVASDSIDLTKFLYWRNYGFSGPFPAQGTPRQVACYWSREIHDPEMRSACAQLLRGYRAEVRKEKEVPNAIHGN